MLPVYTRKTDRIVFFIAKAELSFIIAKYVICAFPSLLQLTVSIISDYLNNEYRHFFWSRANIYQRFSRRERKRCASRWRRLNGRAHARCQRQAISCARLGNLARNGARVSTKRLSLRSVVIASWQKFVLACVLCRATGVDSSGAPGSWGIGERFTTRGRGQRIAAAMCCLGGQRGMTGTGDNGTAPC